MPKSLYEMLMGMAEESGKEVCNESDPASEPIIQDIRPAEEPFRHPWPTFDALSSGQRRWYIWWRNAWMSGVIIDTYPDYIALLAHEMVSYAWNPEPQECLVGLMKLADDFSRKPNAGKALMRWAGDLAWELENDMQAYVLYSKASCSAADGIRNRYIELVRTTEEISRIVISRLYPSTHLTEYRRDILKLFREAFIDGDHYFRSILNISLPEALGRKTREYLPYMGLKVNRTVSFRTIQAPKREDPIPMLVGFLKAVENLHREAVGNKARLKVGALPDGIKEFIQSRSDLWPTLYALRHPVSESQSIRIRKGVVSQLHKESIQVSKMAEEWLGPDKSEYPDDSLFKFVDPSSSVEVRAETEERERTNVGEHLSALAVELLKKLIVEGHWSEADSKQWCRENGKLLATLLDEINDSSFDVLDCPLVLIDDGKLAIDSDFVNYAKTLIESESGRERN